MAKKKNKKSGKSVNGTQVLFVCGVGMISMLAGLILFGVVQSYLAPEAEIEKPEVIKIIQSEAGNLYEVEFLIKNVEKKSVKVELLIKLGFDVYRMRHAHGPKANFYRFFQMLKEMNAGVVLPAGSEQKLQYKLELGPDVYKKFELNSETKIYPRVKAEKVTWA